MATERWVDVWKKKAILADWPTLRLLLGVLAGYTTVNLMLRGISGQVPPAVVAMWRLLPLCLYTTAMMTRESERKALATLGCGAGKGCLSSSALSSVAWRATWSATPCFNRRSRTRASAWPFPPPKVGPFGPG